MLLGETRAGSAAGGGMSKVKQAGRKIANDHFWCRFQIVECRNKLLSRFPELKASLKSNDRY